METRYVIVKDFVRYYAGDENIGGKEVPVFVAAGVSAVVIEYQNEALQIIDRCLFLQPNSAFELKTIYVKNK